MGNGKPSVLLGRGLRGGHRRDAQRQSAHPRLWAFVSIHFHRLLLPVLNTLLSLQCPYEVGSVINIK